MRKAVFLLLILPLLVVLAPPVAAQCADDPLRESNVVLLGSKWEGDDRSRMMVTVTNIGTESAFMKICFDAGPGFPEGSCEMRTLFPETPKNLRERGSVSEQHRAPQATGWVLWRWVDIPDEMIFDDLEDLSRCAKEHPEWEVVPVFSEASEQGRTRVWWHAPGDDILTWNVREAGWPLKEKRRGGKGLP